MPRHFPPLLHATAAAHRRSVHRLEDGMPAHGRLPTILLRLGRRELHTDKILGVSLDRLQTHASNVRAICRGQLELRTELRPPEPHKRLRLRHAAILPQFRTAFASHRLRAPKYHAAKSGLRGQPSKAHMFQDLANKALMVRSEFDFRLAMYRLKLPYVTLRFAAL